ncbi:MAG TPA: hypothetical protein VHU20_08155 [Candidatus Eisenbacteria bacterium]|jgi:hypothetical protein|nr:hypothetical protein [Candidatus Eisenbacteria bacterium]HZV91363.1 hypothetical protein [Candidatus Nitrosocosmicus sp.]
MSDEFRVGEWVRHPEFGDGLVLEARGSGESHSVLVSFPDNSRRRLMVKFARLSKVEPPEGHHARAAEPESKPRARRKTSRGS